MNETDVGILMTCIIVIVIIVVFLITRYNKSTKVNVQKCEKNEYITPPLEITVIDLKPSDEYNRSDNCMSQANGKQNPRIPSGYTVDDIYTSDFNMQSIVDGQYGRHLYAPKEFSNM